MMDELRPYPEYKESGLPWLGRVPAHWDCLPYRAVFKEIKEQGHIDEPLLSVTISKGVIRQADLLANSSKKDSSNLDKSKYKLVEPGDIAYNKMRAWQGAVGVSRHRGIVSPAYIVVRLRRADNPDYFHFLFRTPGFAKEAERWSYGITSDMWSLRPEHFKLIYSCVPSRPEQEAIVGFLRGFDAKVRRFIRNRRRLIDVLNEQKQAIINRVVTRGLDPNIPLKPSGIDWLGDIPEHWGKRRLKFLVRNWNEHTNLKQPDEVYIALEHVEGWSGRIMIPDAEVAFDSQVKRFQPNDVLFGKLRPYLAKVTRPQMQGVCVGEFLVLRTVEQALLPKFLEQELRSKRFIDIINSSTFGAKMPRADWTFIGNLMIVYPPTHTEQLAILAEIEKQTAALQIAIERSKREIDLIREYRTRIITDVVTGKLDVRHLVLETADIIRFPEQKKQTAHKANVYFKRAVFAAEIVARLHKEPTFGHVKFEKLIFLCEKKCGVDLGSTYYRQAAGPYDNRALRSIDSQIEKRKWYAAQNVEGRYQYVSLTKAGDHKTYFDRYFADIENDFSNVIETFRKFNTERCEIVATLYSAWEDLLANGQEAADDHIVEQVLHHWHPSKQRIDEDRWRRAIKWMKDNGFAPKARGVSHGNK